jgi:ABC-2 type transport system ATP-binding protein
LVTPTSGEVQVLGFDALRHGPELRQFIGYMPEHDCLPLDVSATEFVSHMAQINGLPRAAARERTAETLRHVGLFEERYREMKGSSTGMKQRVKLAQALVHDPRLMLLDEPTNGLDPAGRDEMLDLVRRTGREFGIAVMMSSHLLSEIERVCDHLVVIEGGKLVRSGPLGSFTERTQVLAIEVDGDGIDEFIARLRNAGLQVVEENHTVLVGIGESRPYDFIRDSVADFGLALVRIEQRRQSLEDLFRPQHAEEEAHDVAAR